MRLASQGQRRHGIDAKREGEAPPAEVERHAIAQIADRRQHREQQPPRPIAPQQRAPIPAAISPTPVTPAAAKARGASAPSCSMPRAPAPIGPSYEADEQSRPTTRGAKGGDRGKRGKGRYAPDTESGRRVIRPILRTEGGKGKPPGNRVKAIPFSSLRHRASKTSVFRRAMAPEIAAFPSPPTHSREAREGDLTRGASLSTPQTQADFSPVKSNLFRCYSAVTPLLRSDEFPCSTGIHCRFVRPGTRFLSRFASAWLLLEVAARADRRASEDPMIFSFGDTKVCHYNFSRSERLRMLRRMVSSEWRIGDEERTIRHSLIATGSKSRASA